MRQLYMILYRDIQNVMQASYCHKKNQQKNLLSKVFTFFLFKDLQKYSIFQLNTPTSAEYMIF